MSEATDTRVRGLTKAEELALHLHRRLATDGRAAWLFGPPSRTWELLTEAVAETLGGTPAEVARDLTAVIRPTQVAVVTFNPVGAAYDDRGGSA